VGHSQRDAGLLRAVGPSGLAASMLIMISLAERTEILGLAALMIASALVYLIQTRVVPARESAG
jgi:hypothetical protein